MSSKLPSLFQNQRFYRIICMLILILASIQPLYVTYQYRNKFFGGGYEKQYEGLKKIYYSSQYVQKKNPGIMPDEIFEQFAGGAFLKGLNPILIVHDHPPLGRYIISLSILLFDNAHTILLPLLVLSLIGIFLVGRLTMGNTLLALIPVAIFMNEPLFINKLLYSPLPEPVHLPFIVFTFYCFMRSIKSKTYIRWYILTSILLGCVISIRFFVLGAAQLAAIGVFFLLRQRDIRRMILFAISLPLAIVVLLLSYTRTMMAGYSPIKILGIQKYILAYHKSAFILPLSYWDLLLFNRWHTWWGNYAVTTDRNWIITWPISVVATFVYAVVSLIKRIQLNDYEVLLLLWVVIYSIELSTGYTSTRYFLPVVPFFYILAVSGVRKAVSYFVEKKRKK